MKKLIVQVPLTRGLRTSLLKSDWDKLSKFKWFAHQGHQGRFYAAANTYYQNGKRKHLIMHREILGLKDPKVQVDHRDGNPLNNIRSNLRICTNQQNQLNRGAKADNKCGFKGVNYQKAYEKTQAGWKARIQINGKRIALGIFDSPEKAALAYNEAAKKFHGEFARLNNV